MLSYMFNFVIIHGIPLFIISEGSTQFTSVFWQLFQKGLGIYAKLSTNFHPQIDGQAKRTIQILEDMFKASVINFKGNWDNHLPLIEFTSHNIYHTSIQMAPFEIL